MVEEISLDAYKKAYREVEKEEAQRGFVAHLLAYIVVNAGLVVCNIFFVPGYLWFFWPLIFWGLGLVGHYLGVRSIDRTLEKYEAIAEARARGA